MSWERRTQAWISCLVVTECPGTKALGILALARTNGRIRTEFLSVYLRNVNVGIDLEDFKEYLRKFLPPRQPLEANLAIRVTDYRCLHPFPLTSTCANNQS
jgi:hypothetical protein